MLLKLKRWIQSSLDVLYVLFKGFGCSGELVLHVFEFLPALASNNEIVAGLRAALK